MAEKGGTKILAIVTILTILFSILFSGCIEDDEENNKDKDDNNEDIIYKNGHYYIEYTFSIQSNDSYTIFAPIVYTDRHDLNEIYSSFEVIEGNSRIKVIEITTKDEKYYNLTKYPTNDPDYPEGNRDTYIFNNFGINITGNGNSTIYFNISGDTYYSGLSFEDMYYFGVLIYCEKRSPDQRVNISINLYETAFNRGGITKIKDNSFDLHNGWNNVIIDGFGWIY
jgi:hypothetical protein